jgi:Uma2 family endonuclease
MVPVTVPVHRLSVDDVYRMVDAGVLDEDDRVELVEGVLVEMVPIGPEHDGAVAWLTRHFARAGSDVWDVRVQSTLLIEGGYLLPDLMLVEPPPRTAQPTSALLVVEVAQTSQVRDHEKARDYAAAGVPDYWIVDLAARAVEVHRRPLAGDYAESTTFEDGQWVSPLTADAPVVDVSGLLG